MQKYSSLALKLVCLVAGLAVLLQIAHWFARRDALASFSIPPVPTITNALNTPTPPPESKTAATSAVSLPAPGTNATAATNGTPQLKNMPATAVTAAAPTGSGNSRPMKSSPRLANALGTNNAPANVAARTVLTNQLAASPAGTNTASTNAGAPPSAAQVSMALPRPGGRPPRMGPGSVPPAELPPTVKTRVDRIVDSEILGPVMRPMSMALLGIAGPDVFLRAPNGQTGLIKEGDSIGGVKLLKVGINRVLVEEDGKPKELMIFAGFGGETLMSVTKTNEP